MAYYTSIETRFGETYTADDDNITAFVNAESAFEFTSENEISFATNTHFMWDGNVGSVNDTDLIAFNRAFRFSGTNRRLTGTSGANSGKHAYFVNCTFYFSGTQSNPNNARYPLLGYSADDWDTSRERAIPTAKSGNGTFNFYNCKFIYDMFGSSTNTGIVMGDFVDNTFLNVNPTSGEFVFYPQPGANITGNTTDFTVFTSDSVAGGSIYQFDKAGPAAFEDNSIQNYYIYPVEPAGTFEAPFLSADQVNLYVSGESATNVAPQNPPKIRNQDFSNAATTFNNVAILASPRTELRDNGNIYWRNARNSDNGSSFAPFDRPRVIASRRFERTAYTSPQQDTSRRLIKYHFKGNVNYTTAGTAHSIAVNNTDTVREYITNFDGQLTGTYNFIDGSSSAATEVKDKLDVPISYFKADSDLCATNNSDFYTTQFNFNTTLTALSFLGTTNYQTMYDSDEWASNDSEAAARDGFWIRRDNVNEVDPDDPSMADYGDTDDVRNIAGESANISINDIYAIYKYGVWRQDESTDKFMPFADFPVDNVTNGVFDITGNTVDEFALSSHANSAPYRVINDTELQVRGLNLITDDGDPVNSFTFTELNLNGGSVQGGSLNGKIIDPEVFEDIPLEDQVSFENVSLGGTIEVPTSSGDTRYLQFKDVEVISGETLTVSNTGDGQVVYTLLGTQPSFSTSGDVVGLTKVDIVNADTEIATSVYDITDDVYPNDTDFETKRLVTVSNDSDGHIIASTGGDTTIAGLGSTITKVLIIGTKAGEDTFWQTEDISAGSSVTVNVNTTANSQYAASAVIPDGVNVTTYIDTDTDADSRGKMVINANGILSIGPSITNKLMLNQRGTQAYRDVLAIANSNGQDVVFPVGQSDSGFDADHVIWRTTQVDQAVTMTETNISNLDDPNNKFSIEIPATATIEGVVTNITLRVTRNDLSTGVPGDTFQAGLLDLETSIKGADDRDITQIEDSIKGADDRDITQIEDSIKGADDVDISQAQADIATSSLGIPVSDR